MKLKAWIENQSGCKIQVITSDIGTEYPRIYELFGEEAGLEHLLIVSYSPH